MANSVSRTVQYLYFLRFTIVFWLLIPLLAYKDATSGISSITRGIFTSSFVGQFFGASFFIVCIGMVALLTGRLVCLNGQDRFVTQPPTWLEKTLGTKSEPWTGRTLLFFQIPGFCVIFYLYRVALKESAIPNALSAKAWAWGAMLSGVLVAALFWLLIDTMYYWSYDFSDRGVPARTLLFPRVWLSLPPIDQVQTANATLETGDVFRPNIFKLLHLFYQGVARLGPGYSDIEKHQLWEGHRMATIACLCYLVIYIFLFPLTSPLPQRHGYYVALIGAALVSLLLVIAFFKTPPKSTRWRWVFIALFFIICVLMISGLFVGEPFSFQGFPVLGSVLVLATLLAFIFSALSFWADRYRIPVLTAFLVYLYVSHSVFSRSGEHYFTAIQLKTPSTPLHPAEILRQQQARCPEGQRPCPVIIVTATGGGIHAASWTATVLTELETRMRAANNFSFHNHLLYISTVSGGSDGVVPFLREYYATKPFDSEKEERRLWMGRIRRAANCSSLEAVGWGLEYTDFLHIVFPFVSPNPTHDRSGALESAFERNITSKKCDKDYGVEDERRNLLSVDALTLAGMAEDLKRFADGGKYIPAFALNTTAAETGGRFILANYANDGSSNGVAHAETFLSAYGQKESSQISADLHLATAARLSATFPFVSSAARIDPSFNYSADHFVDGGYIDNDGVSSAIEFLESIKDSVESSSDMAATDDLKDVPILFIEIRDGSDLNPTLSDESFKSQQDMHPLVPCCRVPRWNMFNQLSAPLEAFWQAGHVSVTRRNRRELEYLMDTLSRGHGVKFTHIVFDYQDDQMNSKEHESSQPLSWHLTPSQMDKISREVGRFHACLAQTTDWAINPANVPSMSAVVCDHNDHLFHPFHGYPQ